MKLDSNSLSPTMASPNAKRGRDPEDELYVDNLHFHKRYLSEIMASSLNGLTVGDQSQDSILESTAEATVRSDCVYYSRDEMCLQYSPMSEDWDDSRFGDTNASQCSQPDSVPGSPVSPHKYQKPANGFTCTSSSSNTQSRQRSSDSDSRFPSSPSDICHSADLRRAALLRSVQMRAQPQGPSCFDFTYSLASNTDNEDRKSSPDERDYLVEDCSVLGVSDPDHSEL